MRVIGGEHKGRVLAGFKGKDVRPTLDRVKENVFNIIQSRVRGCSFLDLFAGTGGVGIEALSRGAKRVVFCDNSMDSLTILEKNLISLGFIKKQGIFRKEGREERAELIAADYTDCLTRLKGERFGIVYLDPPYGKGLGEDALKALSDYATLEEEGIAVLESAEKPGFEISGFERIAEKKYGIAYITVFKRRPT